MVMVALVAASMGMFISALAGSHEQATSYVTLCVILLIYAGFLIPQVFSCDDSQSVRIRVSDPSDLHFLPFFQSVFFYISFVFGIKPDVPVESPGCKLQFDTPFMGFHWFFVSHKMVGRKKLSKISNMPLFDLDQILIECGPFGSVKICEVIWIRTH